MNKPITVKILVSVNDIRHFEACTLCFESLRVGWPTAKIEVYANGHEFDREIASKLIDCDLWPRVQFYSMAKTHLADWISAQVGESYHGPLVIADPDIVYWKSCEDWAYPEETLLAGYYNPRMWNDFARCVSVERIHTSMMVFPNIAKLWSSLANAYPLANMKHGEYCPCNPFMNTVMFDGVSPKFWDCCANLYNMLRFVSERAVSHFGELEKSCFDHLNSASFREVMAARMDGPARQGFLYAHEHWVKNPMPGLWPLVDEYYEQKRIQALVRL